MGAAAASTEILGSWASSRLELCGSGLRGLSLRAVGLGVLSASRAWGLERYESRCYRGASPVSSRRGAAERRGGLLHREHCSGSRGLAHFGVVPTSGDVRVMRSHSLSTCQGLPQRCSRRCALKSRAAQQRHVKDMASKLTTVKHYA